MGLWQTGYLDKIDLGYEGCEFSTKPKDYICVHCNSSFPTQDAMLQHRFQEHPVRRPTLLLRGEELPSTRKIISRSIRPEDVFAAGYDKITVDDHLLTLDDLGQYLAKCQDGIRSIILQNTDITSVYELQFQIPRTEELAELDIRFFEFMGSGLLDRRAIDGFVESAKRYPTSRRYLDGIAQYLYGILAKDQKGGSCLEMARYKEKYNQALDILHDFETPLARIISGVVNFNFNVFSSYTTLIDAPKLRASMQFFQDTLFGVTELSSMSLSPKGTPSGEKIPLDSFTDRIIAFSLADNEEHKNDRKKIISSLSDGIYPPEDQFKLRVIAAVFASRQGQETQVRELVRPLINDALYGSWAGKLINDK